jgi:hypothetical protein
MLVFFSSLGGKTPRNLSEGFELIYNSIFEMVTNLERVNGCNYK